MYDLKPILPKYDIQLPTCMYPMKRVGIAQNELVSEHNTNKTLNASSGDPRNDVSESQNTELRFINNIRGNVVNAKKRGLTNATKATSCVLNLDSLEQQIQTILQESYDTSVILQKQERLLKQLEELKKQLAEIRAGLGVSKRKISTSTPTVEMTQNESQIVEQPIPDIVVNAHPNFIPYALLALKNLWKERFGFYVGACTHSSILELSNEAREFQRQLCSKPSDDISKAKIKIILIWMDCEHTEMITSSTMYIPIYGEVNIIRYLCRVGPGDFRYENSQLCNEIDAVLDICYQLLRCKTAKAKADLIRLLSSRLQKKEYFGGDRISVADVGVFSSFKRLPGITEKDLTPQLKKWQKLVEALLSA